MVPAGDREYTNAFGESSSLPRYVPDGWLELSYPSFSTLARRAGSMYPVPELDRVASESWDINTDVTVHDRPDVIVTVDELMARAEEYDEKIRVRESKTRDPSTVHPNQSGLQAFEDFNQVDVNPEVIEADERIEHLPAFLPEDETPNVSKYDPTTGAFDECNDCNGKDPWLFPLERGVDALRPGSIEDGNPDFSHQHECDDPKRCEVCGCPRCNAKSTEYRSTLTPAYRCNSCELEFHNVVKRERDDDQRARLHWRCRHCGIATKAPFAGIPEERLPEDIDF